MSAVIPSRSRPLRCAALPDCAQGDNFDETQSTVQVLQTALQDYGGNMRQLLQDEKGTIALAVFGLPTKRQEDDAARAIRTALALTSQTKCRAAGVATGEVLTGLMGSSQRCEYSIVGEAANTAARLMEACHLCYLLST